MSARASGVLWFLLLTALPSAGCILVQPLDGAAPDDNGGTGTAGASSSHAGAPGSAGRSSGSSGATGTAGRGASGSGSGGAPATGKALFIGTWTITSGSTTIDCAGTQSTQPLTGKDTWSAGTTSDLVLDAGTSCPMNANITRRTATGEPGFKCTTSGTNSSSGATYTTLLVADSYTFVVSSDDKTATGMLSGTATYTTGGSSVPCAFSEQAAYVKN